MQLHKKFIRVLLLLAVLGSTLAWRRMTRDEQAIRALDTAWSQAAGARDLDKTVSFYADDASMLPANAPIASGKEAIHTAWSQLMALPGFSLSFAPSKIVIAKAGDMAYKIGTYHLTVNDAQGKPAASVGKYVVNWQKRGGQWKVVADIFNDDK